MKKMYEVLKEMMDCSEERYYKMQFTNEIKIDFVSHTLKVSNKYS